MADGSSTAQSEFKHAHLFCGLGGGAKGFNRSRPSITGARARWRCIGGTDNDRATIEDFTRAAGVRDVAVALTLPSNAT